MLVPLGFPNTCAGSGSTLPDLTEKKCQRLGNQPDGGRLCRNGVPASRAWSGDPHKRESADALLVLGEKAETTQTIRIVPTTVGYWVCTTFPRERRYRAWVLKKFADRPLLDAYQELARKFPHGLAEVPPLPEEISGAATGGTQS